MSQNLYKLIFDGELVPGRQRRAVLENLSKLFKISEEKIDRFFSGPPVLIRKNLDHETACRYRAALLKAGALCSVVAHSDGSAETVNSVSRATPVWDLGERQGMSEFPAYSQNVETSEVQEERQRKKVTCPRCGHEGDNAVECLRCGIIFQRFQGKHAVHEKGGSLASTSITFYDSAKEKRQFLLLAFLVALLTGILYYNLQVSADIRHPPGILVASEPEQVIIKNGIPWRKGDRLFVPLARFSMAARVLGAERYRFDRLADICPVDLALGWGPMSDQKVLDQLEIAQGSRRFFLAPFGCDPPLPWPVIMSHSSNMHMIPANEAIKKSLRAIRVGAIVEVSGFLLGIQEGGRWTWFSSLSRTDTGDGACEIVWVEHVAFTR